SQLPPSIHAGGANRLRKLGTVGSCGAIHGANRPDTMTMISKIPPTTASRFFRKRRQKSASDWLPRAQPRRHEARCGAGAAGVVEATIHHLHKLPRCDTDAARGD